MEKIKIKDIDVYKNEEEKRKLIEKVEKFNDNVEIIMKKIVEEQINNLVNYGTLCPPQHLAARITNGLIFYGNGIILDNLWNVDDIKIEDVDVHGDFIRIALQTPTSHVAIGAEYCPTKFDGYRFEYDDEELKHINIQNYATYEEFKKRYLELLIGNIHKILTLTRQKLEETYEKEMKELKERLKEEVKEEIIQELTHQNEEEEEDEEDEEEEVQYP